jgi:WD40 repeat protein
MIRLITISTIWLSFSLFAQVELAVQKGHSSDIISLEFSASGQYLASLADNKEVIIWEVIHEKSLSSFTLEESDVIKGMKFTDDEKQLKIRTEKTIYYYDLITSVISNEADPSDTLYRQKTKYFEQETNYETTILDGAIKKKRRDKRLKKYKLSVNYLNAPFTAFDISLSKDLIIGVAEDEMIYAYSYSRGLKKKVLSGHNSAIHDIRFTPNGEYFATAGKDRSIIIWKTETFEMETRLSSNVFRKKTATFSENGSHIFVGDELGYIYEIDLEAAFPKINVIQPNYQSVNKIVQITDGSKSGYYIASSNNYVYYKTDIFSEKAVVKYAFRDHSFLKAKKRILQTAFKVYQTPFGETSLFDISPDKKNIIYSGKSDAPNVSIANLRKEKVRHLYDYENMAQWSDIGFTSDSTFIAIHDTSNVLYNWKFIGRKFYLKTDTLSLNVKNFEYIGNNEIWINSVDYGQFIYNLNSRKLDKKMDMVADNVFFKEGYVVLASNTNALVFYDLNKESEYFSFEGHSDKITDVNFHPKHEIFISSSDDGTVKLWNIKTKSLLSTVIPFRNKEFVFITPENNYLITKGAMDEIGFKHHGEYFYPEQFDLKFNRPDKVLSELGFTDSALIYAYHKAYLKRLKKMNFTEEQLSSEFHLPKVKIENRLAIPQVTDESFLMLDVELTDDKYKLDRVNVWVNSVAIFGIKGISLRGKDVQEYKERIKVDLALGRNKVEVSVLNQTGAESYKQTIEVECTAGKTKPSLYVVSIGVSKHKESKYDLNYAEKDAKDIAASFKQNTYFRDVKTKTLTNEQVTLENLAQIKPFLEEADINDVVILFVAGHGVLNADFDYYFASHDMNFSKPELRGIPYGAIESLLDGIKALKKLLLIDTCHSGELDKDEIEETTDETEVEDGEIIFRRVGRTVRLKDGGLGLQSTNELMKSLFTDLRKGTGATVISSSGGAELSIEGGDYQNGLFTHCLLSGLQSGLADLDKDKSISVSEIQIYIRDEVSRISEGRQTPTSRIQNNELDYRLW